MKLRALPALLALALVLPLSALGHEGSVSTDNYAHQNYDRWASPVNSYLYENPAGGLTRVEYADGQLLVEDFDDTFRKLSGRVLPLELELWGGFFAGKDYNFVVVGQNNEAEEDDKEVLRVIQYDKDWNRLGSASLKEANTYHPFDAGSCRLAEYGGELYLRTCHEMYATSDGLHHQASVTLCVRESDMKVLDAWYEIMNLDYGYVSHSFNQFVLIDGEQNIVCLDHGDAYPRSAVVIRYPTKAGNGIFSADYSRRAEHVDVHTYPGRTGDNTTGASVGDLGETSRGYLVAHTWDGQGGGGARAPYLAFVTKDSLTVTDRALPWEEGRSACPPFLVSTGTDSGCVLWCEANDGVNTGTRWYYLNPDGSRTYYTPETQHGDDTLYYVTYGADGSFGSVRTAENVPLSDCHPILYRGKVTWYVTDRSEPTFYTLDETGVAAHPVNKAPAQTEETGFVREAIPTWGTAYANTQQVELDGVKITLPVYALRTAAGDTNYVRLRDLAALLANTAGQFDVDWSAENGIFCTSHHPYDHPTATDGKAPFTGDQPYAALTDDTRVNGRALPLTAFRITYQGGGHTYFKLRDLGKALGFNVGWSAGRGMFLETDKPYTDAD